MKIREDLKLTPGKWYMVLWVDTVGSVASDPAHASSLIREEPGCYVGTRDVDKYGFVHIVHVFRRAKSDPAASDDSEDGYLAMPQGMILAVEPWEFSFFAKKEKKK